MAKSFQPSISPPTPSCMHALLETATAARQTPFILSPLSGITSICNRLNEEVSNDLEEENALSSIHGLLRETIQFGLRMDEYDRHPSRNTENKWEFREIIHEYVQNSQIWKLSFPNFILKSYIFELFSRSNLKQIKMIFGSKFRYSIFSKT